MNPFSPLCSIEPFSQEGVVGGIEFTNGRIGGLDACLTSEKMQGIKAVEKGENPEKPAMVIRWFSDLEISMTIFTFLFASQDATSSAATWLFQIMAQRPEILDRVREENLSIRNGDPNAPVTLDQLDAMTYTRAVVRELLRYRPPVLMTPYVAKKAFPISDTYTVPKGRLCPLSCIGW